MAREEVEEARKREGTARVLRGTGRGISRVSRAEKESVNAWSGSGLRGLTRLVTSGTNARSGGGGTRRRG